MADRRNLQEELNRVNTLFQEKDLEMRKAGASIEQRQQMRDMLNNKKERLIREMGDDLQKLNLEGKKTFSGGTVSKALDQDNLIDMAKQRGLGKSGMFSKTFGKLGKKVAGVLPLAGAGMAALSGDPAMAAEELAGDIPIAGQIYEAIKPSDSGNPEEEAEMLAERDAIEQYKGSQASKDRLSKLKSLIGKK